MRRYKRPKKKAQAAAIFEGRPCRHQSHRQENG
jgi:hypothetical protein